MDSQPALQHPAAHRLRLAARIISVPIILVALGIAIGNGYSWITGVTDPNAVADYPFIENVPPFLLFFVAVGLLIAWFRERIGAWVAITLCAATLIVIPFTIEDRAEFSQWTPMLLVLIAALPGVLFLLDWRAAHKTAAPNE